MGGLKKYMPITYWTRADRRASPTRASRRSPASSPRTRSSRRCTCRRRRARTFAYLCVLAPASSSPRPTPSAWCSWPSTARALRRRPPRAPHESPAVVTVPLVLLAIPSIGAGWLIGPVVFGDFFGPRSRSCRASGARRDGRRLPRRPRLHRCTASRRCRSGSRSRASAPPGTCTWCDTRPAQEDRHAPSARCTRWSSASTASTSSTRGCSRRARARSGTGLWKGGDQRVIDGRAGERLGARWWAGSPAWSRLLQTGLIYRYAFMMIFGVLRGLRPGRVTCVSWHGA